MLKDVSGVIMDGDPHKDEWNTWRSNINDLDFNLAKNSINEYIDDLVSSDKSNILEAAWIVGKDWTGGPYQSLYYATGKDQKAAGFFIGLVLWHVLREREEEWVFIDDQERKCKQYFLV